MAGGSARSSRVRTLVTRIASECSIRADAQYDRRRWILTWNNGPTRAHLAPRVARHAHQLGVDASDIELDRIVQPNALPVQAIRLGLAGQLPLYNSTDIARAITSAAEATDYPDRPADDRERLLAARLASAVPQGDERAIAEFLRARGGIGFLMTPPAEAAPSAPCGGPAATPVEAALAQLTASYATGPAATAWRERAALLPAEAALASVAADRTPPADLACAGLTVLRSNLEDLEHTELALLIAARAGGATWAQIGSALGTVNRQTAQKRHGDLSRRAKVALVSTDGGRR